MDGEPQTRRFIFTGTSGSGKTSVIRKLQSLGHAVVDEAITDLILQKQQDANMSPWTNPEFIDEVVNLQRQRQEEAFGILQFYDRSVFCTYALARYLNYTPSRILLAEIDRCKKDEIYQNRVFFFENLGFIEGTATRKISYEDSLIFERIHMDVYREFGFEIVSIKKESILNRCDFILRHALYANST